MKDLTDFAVIARRASTELIKNLTGQDTILRVVPLKNAPTLSEALGGLFDKGVATFNANQNMTLEANGSISKSNIHSVQDRANGYVRVVARINNEDVHVEGGDTLPRLINALGFALLKGIVEGEGANAHVKGWEVLAVASLQAGCDIADGCYVAFTFSKTNNYQSVSFSPNAFATIEDLNNINGLDGLHIAFDHASGDIKLLDGKGNVLDQANLHMDADTIIADGEEGYKYVKTDIQQDIHAEKDFMPAGYTAQNSVSAQAYVPKTACFLVEVDGTYASYQAALAGAQAALAGAQAALAGAQAADPQVPADVDSAQAAVDSAQAAVDLLTGEAIRKGDSTAVKGIRVYTISAGGDASSPKDYVLSDEYDLITGSKGQFLKEGSPSEDTGKSIIEVYSPDAFVWTVGKPADLVKAGDDDAGDNNENVGKVRVVNGSSKTYHDPTFAEQMNIAADSMRFHVGDDIPLGSYIATLIGTGSGAMNETNGSGFDAEKFMHEGTDSDYIDELVDKQRNLAKEELVAWNAQHPALERDDVHGTRISENGLDVRNGSIQIGNAQTLGNSVKRAVIETDFADSVSGDGGDEGSVDTRDRGLQIGLIETQDNSQDVKKDILTINAEDYISGAPTCLALLKCEKPAEDVKEDNVTIHAAGYVYSETSRITANFTASGSEADGVFTLTITDNRANNGFGGAPRIVEIIPVYKSGADAQEAVPAQRSITAIELAQDVNGKSTLSIQCSQVLDWAQSIALGGDVDESGKPVNGMELYLIVKVY